jgi:hypothetical protein
MDAFDNCRVKTSTRICDLHGCCDGASDLGVCCRCVSAGVAWLQAVGRLDGPGNRLPFIAMDELPPEAAALVRPDRVWSREEVLGRPSPVPAVAGAYAWYFKQLPAAIDSTKCVSWSALNLLYVGISPKAPPASGVGASRQNLRRRLRQHYALNAYGSTLRLTLGCLLADQFGIELRRVGSGTRLTFADGEPRLSQWMAANAFVCWVAHERPWELEHALLKTLDLPLNLQGNDHHPFRNYLRTARATARDRARALPVWPN